MNLVAYDIVNSSIDKRKSWIDINNKRLYSRELPLRRYVAFGKRFNTETSETIYYIIVLDDPPQDRTYSRLIRDSYGRTRISLKSVWLDLGINSVNDFNITIKHTEHTDDGDIFELIL